MVRQKSVARVALSATLIAATVTIGATQSGAAASAERHCVVEVIGEAGGVLITGPERCFKERGDAAAYDPAADRHATTGTSVTSSSNTIGRHFTGPSFSGSSIKIVGTTCSGGKWYPTSTWNDNIESSEHHCGSSPTKFHDHAGCSGDDRSITSAIPTLYEMSNRASCVSYG